MAKGKQIIVHPRYKHTLPVLHSHGSFSALPPEVLHMIAEACDSHQALCTFSMLNKQCWAISHEDDHWKLQLTKKFGFCPDSDPPAGWKAFYRFQHEFFLSLLLKNTAEWASTGPRMRFGGGFPQVPMQNLVI